MATPTEVDRCRRLEERDATLTSLKLTISSYSNAQPTFSALRKSSHLKELFITSSLEEHDIGRLCREVLLQNSSLEHLTLDLRECNDRGARHLADLIQYSRNLQWLSLLLNNVSEKGALQLAEALANPLFWVSPFTPHSWISTTAALEIAVLRTLQALSSPVGASLLSA